ncbi:hypothetical protein [Clostridium sp. DJ247]|uniref:hypothetical protein n=1 Tax=Clostridium sp. DJ247 TaxID=2726188 RepID=UPI0016278737|nr:hypothetical protein [Clostridium sp. DJ247]
MPKSAKAIESINTRDALAKIAGVGHDTYNKGISKIFEFQPKPEDTVNKYLDVIEEKTRFKHWFFGHFHEDIELDSEHTLLYEKIIKIQ